LPGERGRLVARVGGLIGGNKRPCFRILGIDFGHHHYDEWIAIVLLGKPSADFLTSVATRARVTLRILCRVRMRVCSMSTRFLDETHIPRSRFGSTIMVPVAPHSGQGRLLRIGFYTEPIAWIGTSTRSLYPPARLRFRFFFSLGNRARNHSAASC
jgi:hypothetical protein